MKSIIIACAVAALLFLFGCRDTGNMLSVEVNTQDKSENISTDYTVENWGRNSKLVSISLTNKGNKTEYINDILVKLNNTPVFDEKSKFLYCAYQMSSQTPIQQRGYNDDQLFTESLFMVKNAANKYFKVGVLTWEIFRASITFSKENGVTISAEGENKPIKPGETIEFEKFVIETGDNWQDMMFGYGEQIAKIHSIKPQETGKWKGWGSWDYYGHNYTMEDITSNMEQLKALNIGANVIQLDASWWVNRGDYLETRSNLPGGMKGVAKVIIDNGFVAGLHLDGMRAVSTAMVYKDHPDWFLKDQDGNTIYAPFRDQLRVFFDYSNPATCEYIKNVLKTMTTDWGYQYIKVDFLAFGLNREIFESAKDSGLKKVVAFDTTMTSMERSRAGFAAMREGIGEAYFLGCSSVFGPNFGLIDALRTGPDINPRYEAYRTHALQNAGNFYLNQTVVQNDADYMVVRSKEDEDSTRAQGVHKFGGNVSLNEAAMWADYVALFGGIKLSGDDLSLLRTERKELAKKAFSINTCQRFIPIDLWDKAKDKSDAFNIILGTNEQGVFLALFNWKNEELGFKLSNIPTEKLNLVSGDNQTKFHSDNNALQIKLKGRTSVIFQVTNAPAFEEKKKSIGYEFFE